MELLVGLAFSLLILSGLLYPYVAKVPKLPEPGLIPYGRDLVPKGVVSARSLEEILGSAGGIYSGDDPVTQRALLAGRQAQQAMRAAMGQAVLPRDSYASFRMGPQPAEAKFKKGVAPTEAGRTLRHTTSCIGCGVEIEVDTNGLIRRCPECWEKAWKSLMRAKGLLVPGMDGPEREAIEGTLRELTQELAPAREKNNHPREDQEAP